MMAFTQKRINVSFSMETGAFGATNSNTGTLSSGPAGSQPNTLGGLRITSQIVNAGGNGMGQLECMVYGMTLNEMNQLATTGTQIGLVEHNSVTLEAGDAESGMSTVFQGTISLAFFDGQSMPEVGFRVLAHSGLIPKVQPQRPVSIAGKVEAKTLLQTAAQQLGFPLEANGIDGVQLTNHYAGGSGIDQIISICRAAGLEWAFDKNTVVVTKPGQARQTSSNYLISPETDMVGYPAFNQGQVIVKQLWRPGLGIADPVTIKSQITPANGDWKVNRIDYELDANIPNGRWFQTVYASRIGLDPPPPAST